MTDQERNEEREDRAAERRFRQRTFKVTIETMIDAESSHFETVLDQKAYILQVDCLEELSQKLSILQRPHVKKFNMPPVVPEELKDDWDIIDWMDDGPIPLSPPKGRLVLDLGDGRALVGLQEWSPNIRVNHSAEVTLKMYLAKKKKKKEDPA